MSQANSPLILCKKYDMAIENIGQLKHISGALLAGKKVNVFTNKNAKELIQNWQKNKNEE